MDYDKLILRPFTAADQEQILDALTSDMVNKTFMLPDYEKREDAIPQFRRLMELSGNSERFVRCIALGGTAIGFLNDVEIHGGEIELGYVIHPDYHNRGYMTAALKQAISELFDLGFACVVCGAFEENKASQRVMEKAGMTKIEKVDLIEYRGQTHRCVYFHLLHK